MSLFHYLFLPHESNNQRARVLHPSGLTAVIALFLGFQALLSQASLRLPEILGYASQIAPEEIIRLTNVQRQSQGLSPVKLNSLLSQAAQSKAGDMFARDYWAHVSPSGVQPWYFITQSGYSYRYAGENLARDFSDPKSVVDAWMASPTHRDNLLNSRYQEIGIAVVDGQLEGRETTLVVQFFGTPLAAVPTVNSANSFAVKAVVNTPIKEPVQLIATTSPEPVVAPVNPFTLTKIASLSILVIILIVLFTDVVIVSKQKIVRWTSKSVAHLIFIGVLVVAAALILRGQIL